MEAVVLQDVVPLVEEVVLEVVEEAAVEEEDLKKALQLKLSVSLHSLLIFIYNNKNITFRGWSIHSQCRERDGLPSYQRHDSLFQRRYLP